MLRWYKYMMCIFTVLCATNTFAGPQEDGVVPETLVLDQRWSYDNYTHLVIPTIDWLQNTPLDSNKKLRSRHDNFLMYWLQKNEEVAVHMPEYLINFQNADRELYFIYSGGWIKYALQNDEETRTDCSIAAVEAVLDYYANDNGVAQNDYLDHLLQIQKDGKLNNLFDSSENANNTYIFLKPPADKHEFNPNENYFTFKYTGINFTRSTHLKYRYKLEGYYDKWIETDEETVTFPNLPSGDFTFIVEASTYQGFEHAVSDSYSFSITTPFYKRGWFFILVVLFCIGVITGYMRWRERQLKKIAELQHERVLFEYEYLKSQVNPHFLFNSLNTLTSLIDSNPKAAIKYTDHLSDLYRNMLAHPDDNLVTLAEELDILQNYLHIQKSRFGEALILKMNISDELRNNKRIVYLALQLVVENAIKHNVISQTQPLEITLTANEKELIVSNPINTKVSREKSNGMGLANISKRYALATNRTVAYGEVDGNFVVKLPLL